MDIAILLPLLNSTSGVALSCRGFARQLKSNGFLIKTSFECLCPDNLSFYKLLNLDELMRRKISRAIRDEKPECLQLLLDSGADIEATDIDGDTFLNEAACFGEIECLKVLLENKADIEAKNSSGYTALIFAARFGKTACLEILLEHKADPNVRNIHTCSALALTACERRTDCLKLLLRYGAKVDSWERERYPRYSDLWKKFSL